MKQSELNANTVFIADTLKTVYPEFHKELTDVLSKHNVRYDVLQGTKGIWARDYTPVQTNKGFFQFKYVGHSLTEAECAAGITQFNDVDYAALKIPDFKVIHSPIIADGGNFVKGPSATFICDSLFKRNSDMSTRETYLELENIFGRIVIIPQMPEEIIGHADGYVRPVYNNLVVRNAWNGIENGEPYNVDEDRTFLLTLLNANFIVKDLPNAYDMENMYSDFGDYGNYLVVNKLVVMQRYGIPEDKIAMDMLKNLFGPEYVFDSVDCNIIAKDGGALNCCTWTVCI